MEDLPELSMLVVQVLRLRLPMHSSGNLRVAVSVGAQRIESAAVLAAAALEINLQAFLAPAAGSKYVSFQLLRTGFLGSSSIGKPTHPISSRAVSSPPTPPHPTLPHHPTRTQPHPVPSNTTLDPPTPPLEPRDSHAPA